VWPLIPRQASSVATGSAAEPEIITRSPAQPADHAARWAGAAGSHAAINRR